MIFWIISVIFSLSLLTSIIEFIFLKRKERLDKKYFKNLAVLLKKCQENEGVYDILKIIKFKRLLFLLREDEDFFLTLKKDLEEMERNLLLYDKLLKEERTVLYKVKIRLLLKKLLEKSKDLLKEENLKKFKEEEKIKAEKKFEELKEKEISKKLLEKALDN